jgi:glycosyltransferase involved in cell wall biosynthesis
VLVEAMAVGLPCVAFSCSPGPRSIVSHHNNGILVEKDNVQKLSEAICYMIENNMIREEYAAHAQNDAARYRVESIMQKWIALFDAIM